jgi:predicted alpha/beta superfamily hydrolase
MTRHWFSVGIWPVLLLMVLLPSLPIAAGERIVQEVFVTVPGDTPGQDSVFLAGNLRELGNWQPDGFKLHRLDDGRWTGSLSVNVGARIACKVTRGNWATVETAAGGEEIPNRCFFAERGVPIDITVGKWKSSTGGNIPTWTGNIRTHAGFSSRLLRNTRDVWVYLPPGYDQEPSRRYPVLYLHDGQNVFNAGSSFGGTEWGADEAAEKLIRTKEIVPLILVGVANTSARMDEYTPCRSAGYPTSGQGKLYGRFLVEELKPFIDAAYRTRRRAADTAIAGSSLGGLISLYLAVEFPKVFGRFGVLSPSIWWENRWILSHVERKSADLKGKRLWIDMGTREGDSTEGFLTNLGNLRDLRSVLIRAGLKPGVSLGYLEAEGAVHNEGAWAGRMEDVLRFLFPLGEKGGG